MATLAEQLTATTKLLAPVTETPRLDAEILLAHALNTSRTRLLAQLQEHVSAPEFEVLVERRLRYEPIAYITGRWEFFSLEFEVGPPVLVPRPETEHLVETVVEFVEDRSVQVLDIGTGTGCVAIAVARNAPQCLVTATDIDTTALEFAARNIQRHDLSRRVTLRQGDLFGALEKEEYFDAICCNPPYVEELSWHHLPPVIRLHEDPAALLAGEDGLSFIQRLIAESPCHLHPGGLLAFEIGMGQRDAVYAILAGCGFEDLAFRRDLAGIDRIAVAKRPLS